MTGGRGPRRLLRRFALAVGYLVFLVFILEVVGVLGLRATTHGWQSPASMQDRRSLWMNPVAEESAQVFRAPVVPDELYMIHPYLGYVLDMDKMPGDTTSDLGFMADGPTIVPAKEETLEIYVVGGSVARNFAIGQSTGRDVLRERLLESPVILSKFDDVRIVNASVAGYKQPQQLMTAAYLLSSGAQMDMIINLDGLNEIWYSHDLADRFIAAIYPGGWYTFVNGLPDDPEMQKRFGVARYLEGVKQSWATFFSMRPLRYSFSANLVWFLSDKALTRRIAESDSKYRSLVPRAMFRRARGPFKSQLGARSIDEVVADIWSRSSTVLNSLCRGSDIAYLHFLQPNQYVLNSKTMGAEERAIAWSDGWDFKEIVPEAYPLLQARGRELMEDGIEFYDLTDVFKEVDEQIYIDPCCHINKLGNSLIAEEVAIAIIAHYESIE